jgi:hypothetical protein
MCIAILNNGKKLTRNEMSNCWVSNDDGAGMLFIKDGYLQVIKQPNTDGYSTAGAAFDKFYKDYEEVYFESRKFGYPVLIHFRIATHGLDPEYLHPFLVSDSVGLIHNGIIYGYGTRDVSDTAEFTAELATLPSGMTQNVEFLDIPFVSNSIYDKLEANNKLVFMDDRGEYRIFGEELGHWVGGNWFSNDAYKTRTTYFGSTAGKPTSKYQPRTQTYYDKWYDQDFYDSPYGTAIKPSADYQYDSSKAFVTDKKYDCFVCADDVYVNEDACCVECGSYIIESESDVVNKLLQEDEMLDSRTIIMD